jgi:hypothetical protein
MAIRDRVMGLLLLLLLLLDVLLLLLGAPGC